jgi:hypothetical protein
MSLRRGEDSATRKKRISNTKAAAKPEAILNGQRTSVSIDGDGNEILCFDQVMDLHGTRKLDELPGQLSWHSLCYQIQGPR